MRDMPVYLDIRIPVITLRIVLIFVIISFVSFGVLLPLSFLSFNYLYGYLIPTPNINLPLSNYILNYDFQGIPPFIIIGKTLDPLYANQPRREEHHEVFDRFDFNMNYDFNFNFDAFCPRDSDLKYEPIMYKLSIVSNDLVDQLSPYGTKPYVSKRFNIWPVTNNIHQLHNPQVLVSSMNTFILDCNRDSDPRNEQNVRLKSLLPPILQWFVPTLVQNVKIASNPTRFTINLFKDLKFKDYLTAENIEYFTDKEFNILLEFNKPNIVIDPSSSEIIIHCSWRGLKYYLYHYRILSYILGVSVLWLGSSSTLFATVGGLVAWREVTVGNEEANDANLDEDDDEDDIESIINQHLIDTGSITDREFDE